MLSLIKPSSSQEPKNNGADGLTIQFMTEPVNIAELWDQLHVRLCRFICSRISNPEDAEDILQNVFLRIHTNLSTVRNQQKLESWVYQIARNSIIDNYRSHKAPADLNEIAVLDEYPEEDVPESLAPYIREVIDSLPSDYRQALISTELDGISQVEYARRYGLSLSGAKSRVQRARQKVKDIMLTCCHFEFDVRGLIADYYEHCCCCCVESDQVCK